MKYNHNAFRIQTKSTSKTPSDILETPKSAFQSLHLRRKRHTAVTCMPKQPRGLISKNVMNSSTAKIHTQVQESIMKLYFCISTKTGQEMFTCGPMLHSIREKKKKKPCFHHCAQTQCWWRCQATVALCYNMRPGPSHTRMMRKVRNITAFGSSGNIQNSKICSVCKWKRSITLTFKVRVCAIVALRCVRSRFW